MYDFASRFVLGINNENKMENKNVSMYLIKYGNK